MTKTERLFYLLELLRCGKKFKISEIAAAGKTSERTVFRDLKALVNLGYHLDSESGYSLSSHNFKPLPGQFNDVELRLIQFAVETHQLGTVFPFTDLAARLDISKAPVSSPINLSAASDFTLTQNESANRLMDKTHHPEDGERLSKILAEEDEPDV